MKSIEYKSLQELDKTELLAILNKSKVRQHLVSHDEFDLASLEEWLAGKVAVDASTGCRVKGIVVDGCVAGWCGIQFENEAYELAVVLDEAYWGIGTAVFRELLEWVSEFGHSHVVLHLFNTRPEYRFLWKMASRVYQSTIFGQQYTSYQIKVPNA